MNNNKVGPWRREDFESFLALDVHLRPPTNYLAPRNAFAQLGGLLSFDGDGAPAQTLQQQERLEQERLINDAWRVRRAHPVYKWLAKQQAFERAWKAFEQQRKKAATENLRSPTAPFHFLKEFAQCAGWVYERRDARKRGLLRKSDYGPTNRRRRAAISHATALRKLLDVGSHLGRLRKNGVSAGAAANTLQRAGCNEAKAARREERWRKGATQDSGVIASVVLPSEIAGSIDALRQHGRYPVRYENRAAILQRSR